MYYVIYFDGASRGNPGESGIGIAIYNLQKDGSHVLQYTCNKYMGKCTNNQAEYLALNLALHCFKTYVNNEGKKRQRSTAIFKGDSLLVINQMNGKWKVKSDSIRHIHMACRTQSNNLTFLNVDVSFSHIYRNYNTFADQLANKGADGIDSEEHYKKHL